MANLSLEVLPRWVYSSKEEAATAMQKLYYEDELGDQVNIDFYKLKEGRLQEYDYR
jgi:hypothetical protein